MLIFNLANLKGNSTLKTIIPTILFCVIALPSWAGNPAWLEGKTEQSHQITVYRSASCGCCKGWIDHLEDHNFEVTDVTVDDVNEFKLKFNVPPQGASCHTAIVDGVTIEGHVPAQDIKRLLANRGDIRLLTVPAMPSGTPGMDTPGAPKDDFRVYSISEDDRVDVYRTYSNY